MPDRGPRLIVALDYPAAEPALEMAAMLDPLQCRVKVGKELFTAAGPALVRELITRGFDVFLDLKYHDIPNTVGAAVCAAANLGVWMLNVHASGGRRMMEAARQAVDSGGTNKPLLIAVTVLTSLSSDEMRDIGVTVSAADQVLRLARLACDAGMDGLVCSAQEATAIRASLGSDPVLVTPGIRLAASCDDQTRVMSPAAAIAAGSDYLVVGRPVTASVDPRASVAAILSDMSYSKAH